MLKLFKISWLVLAIWTPSAQAEWFDPGIQLARRGGSPSCWAELRLASQQSLCIRHEDWIAHLNREVPLRGEWRGRWKVFSPPLNIESKASGGDPLSLKETRFRFFAQELPIPKRAEAKGVARWANRSVLGIERVRETLSARLEEADRLGIVRKLVINQRTPGTELDLSWSLGLVHVFTASGIHLYALARWIRSLALACGISLGMARGLAGCAWFWVWLLSGMRPGMLRPLLVVSARFGARSLGFRWRAFGPLVLALGADLGVAVFRSDWAPGRWHYALAVGGGLLALELAPKHGVRRIRDEFLDHLAMAWGSWIFCAIWDAWSTQRVALATPLLSLVTLPWVSLGVYPLTVLSLSLGRWTQPVLESGVEGFTLFIEWSEAWARGYPTLWILPARALLPAMGLAAGALVLGGVSRSAWKRALRLGSVIGALSGVAILSRAWLAEPSGRESIADGDRGLRAWRVEQLDVGQGDSALVRYRDLKRGVARAGLIDTGSARGLSGQHWLDLLARRGVTRLEWIALTHLDEDHAGGLERLSGLIPIGCVASATLQWESIRGVKLKRKLEDLGITVADWGSRCFPFDAMPPREKIRRHGRAVARDLGNNQGMSAVWIPLASGWSYLSLGDADHAREREALSWIRGLRARHPGPLLLKLSHHGSKNSSSEAWLKKVGPAAVWISSGVGNTYGHPAPDLLERLRRLDLPWKRTDQRGVLRSP